jgi:integrase
MSAADTREVGFGVGGIGRRSGVIGKLTTVQVRQAKRRGLYGDGGGLFLQVSETGAKSWVFRFKEAGRLRVMGLGPIHTVSLAEARDHALECRKLRLGGRDPIAERKTAHAAARLDAAKAISFKECAEAYMAAHKAAWRNAKHGAQWEATLATYAYPAFGSLSVQAIDVGLVMKAIEPIWNEKTETASRLRGRIEAVIDWATARGHRKGENPARWRGHLENLLPKKSRVHRVQHHPALPYPEIGAFMADLRAMKGVPARALEFAVLTAARTGEVIGARWGEINIAERLWTIPAERMKAGREHRVPLSNAAMAIVDAMVKIRQHDFVFPSNRAGRAISGIGCSSVLKRMRDDLTVHGFRSSFRDWAAESTSFPTEVAEMALAHTVADKVEAAYRRGDLVDKRRQLAEAWARFCAAPAIAGSVVPIRAPAAVE